MKKKTWIAIIFCFLVLGLIWLQIRGFTFLQGQSPVQGKPHESSVTFKQRREVHSVGQIKLGVRSLSSSQLRSQEQLNEAVTEFQEKFGSKLQAEFSSDHRFLRITGVIGQGKNASFEFHPSHEAQVKRRAHEILTSAQDLLEWNAKTPLEISRVSPGQISAQVYFKQKFEGQSIEPEGHVKIDLGPQGELIALYSGYVSKFEIKNERSLSEQQVLQKLFEFLREIHRELKSHEVPQSVPIIWVQGESAYYANQFKVIGMLIVMDAQTGEVLFSKDIRVS